MPKLFNVLFLIVFLTMLFAGQSIASISSGSIELTVGGDITSGGDNTLGGDLATEPNITVVGSPGDTSMQFDDYRLYVVGNLYIDYSVFSDDVYGLVAGQGTTLSLTAENISLYDGTPQTIDFVDAFTVMYLSDYLLPSEISFTGDLLLFSDAAFTDANLYFEASESLFVGNYSFYAPVPVPAAVWMLGSGLVGLIGLKRRKS